MPLTNYLIQTVTIGASGASTIEFTGIPQTYTDLCLKLSNRQSGNGGSANIWDNYTMTFNNSTSSKNSLDLFSIDNSGASYTYASELYFWGNIGGSTANMFTNVEIYIPHYTNTTKNKIYFASSVAEHNSSTNYIMIVQSGQWANTSAITSIKFDVSIGRTFLQYSSASLYGISNT